MALRHPVGPDRGRVAFPGERRELNHDFFLSLHRACDFFGGGVRVIVAILLFAFPLMFAFVFAFAPGEAEG